MPRNASILRQLGCGVFKLYSPLSRREPKLFDEQR